jgi:hypothetical protein
MKVPATDPSMRVHDDRRALGHAPAMVIGKCGQVAAKKSAFQAEDTVSNGELDDSIDLKSQVPAGQESVEKPPQARNLIHSPE